METTSLANLVDERVGKIRHVALDMDGTLYKGSTLFPFTPQFLDRLSSIGVGYTFLTNNSSRSAKQYLEKVRSLGLKAEQRNIYTSSLATLKYLRSTYPTARKVYLIGTQGLKEEFSEAGYRIIPDGSDEEPDLVVVAFDTTLVYDRLCKGAYWIEQGKPYIATHPDDICPTDEATVLIDCGAVCAAIEKATGKVPEAIPGKPNQLMLEGILSENKLEKHELAMVGDRLYTDIAMAQMAGVVGVLVLTGEATMADVESSQYKPDLVLPSVKELGEQLLNTHASKDAQKGIKG